MGSFFVRAISAHPPIVTAHTNVGLYRFQVSASSFGLVRSRSPLFLLLARLFAAAFGRCTFTAFSSLLNWTQHPWISWKIAAYTDLFSGFTPACFCSRLQIALYWSAKFPARKNGFFTIHFFLLFFYYIFLPAFHSKKGMSQ